MPEFLILIKCRLVNNMRMPCISSFIGKAPLNITSHMSCKFRGKKFSKQA